MLSSTPLAVPVFAAQTIKRAVAPAPLPAQILAGKTAFISYAGTNNAYQLLYITDHTGASTGLYDELYAAMKDWGRYELVSAPADADLVFEVRLAGQWAGEGDPHFRLRILDPKTHIVLWSFIEIVPAGSGREASRRKAWDAALTKLVNDVRMIAVQPPPSAAVPHK
jgi:hypothetical protein